MLHLLLILFTQGGNHADQLFVDWVSLMLGRKGAAEVFFHHRNRAGEQVAQIVCKVDVDAADERLVGEVAVRAEWEFPQQKVAQRIHAVAFCQHIRVHHVALGFAHLAAVQQQPAVTIDVFWQRQVERHQDSRPDDGVEANDLLADKVDICRPEFIEIVVAVVLIAQRVDVVGKCVDPNIYDVSRVKINRYTPAEGGTGNAQVLQTGFDEVIDHLVDAAAWLQKVGVFQQVLDAVGILGKTEEVSLFLGVYDRASAVRAFAVHQLGLGPEGFAGLAVFADILAFVDVSFFVQLFEDFLYRKFVVVIGGADEAVVGNVHQLPQIQNAAWTLDDVVYKLFRGDTGFLCLVLDFLTVLVSAGQEHNIIALQAFVASHCVGGYSAVGVTDVQLIRWIIDRRGDIKWFFLIFVHIVLSSCLSIPQW